MEKKPKKRIEIEMKDRFRYSKAIYDPELHHQILMDCAENGESHTSFCVKAGISRFLYERWRKEYPEFKQSVNEYQLRLSQYYEKIARDNLLNNKDFNTPLYTRLMRIARVSTDYVDMAALSKLKTYEEKLNAIEEALCNREIPIDIAQRLLSVLKVRTEIEQNSELKQDIKKLKKLQGID